MSAAVEIRALQSADVDAIVEFSVRAWEPVFESLRAVLGDEIFDRLHQPDWQTVQAESVRSSCTGGDLDVFVAVVDDRPVGFAGIRLNAFHEGMGVVEITAVDPGFQRRGIARLIMRTSIEHMRERGMDIAAVETGGDFGHAPARAFYEAEQFMALPVVRYLRPIR